MLVNPERGETLLEIGGVTVKLHFTLDRLAAFSAMLGSPPLGSILGRIQGAEPQCLLALIDCFTVEGDRVLLKERITNIADLGAVIAAGMEMMKPFLAERKPAAKKA